MFNTIRGILSLIQSQAAIDLPGICKGKPFPKRELHGVEHFYPKKLAIEQVFLEISNTPNNQKSC